MISINFVCLEDVPAAIVVECISHDHLCRFMIEAITRSGAEELLQQVHMLIFGEVLSCDKEKSFTIGRTHETD